MLRFLGVRNLSVIDQLEVEFEPGLNVLTGETGAGKSVLVEAIGLLVGGRATADLIRTGESTATVQAILEKPGVADVIVRREISAQGRSRAFIDDSLATIVALRELGAAHVELHGQHEHQVLVNPAEHVGLLDSFAGHGELSDEVAARYVDWQGAVGALERSRLSDREKQARIEIATYQLQEIERVGPVEGEDESLAGERSVLANADRLVRLTSEAYSALYEGETAALTALATVFKRLSDLAALDPRFGPYLDQREDLKARLEDLAIFLRDYTKGLEASPERLQRVEDRLAAIERVKRRYGPALDDVLVKQAALREELSGLGASEEQVAGLAERERRTRADYVAAAKVISDARTAAGRRLAAALERDLRELAMPACRFEVRVSAASEPDWSARGVDAVEFFISPNPGEEPRPLARVASGGELSRVMLALRIATLKGAEGKTLIFDEVDAGIGGAAADAVGARLQTLGGRHQVLCVTHLAQIAARADAHFQISKYVQKGRTTTSVSRLEDAGRETELGRMIAGAGISAQVLASAREMLATRRSRGRVSLSENSAKGESESPRPAKAKGKGIGR